MKLSRLIFTFIFILNYLFAFCQMQKIYTPVQKSRVEFGRVVNLEKDLAYINSIDGNPWLDFPYGHYFYKKIGKIWKNHHFYNNIDIDQPGYLKFGKFIIEGNNNSNLTIFPVVGDSLVISDQINFNTNTFENVSYFTLSQNWLIIRNNKLKSFLPSSSEYIDYFYHYESRQWRLKTKNSQTVKYIDTRWNDTKGSFNTDDYAVLAICTSDFDSIYHNLAKVDIYKRTNDDWILTQELYEPDVSQDSSRLGEAVSITPNNNYLVAGSGFGNVYIYRNIDGIFKFSQKLVFNDKRFMMYISLINDEMILGRYGFDTKPNELNYYKLEGDMWIKKRDIKPPYPDTTYALLGRGLDRYGETVIAGASGDKKYGDYSGAVYIFQLPARDTIYASVCSGTGYTFGDKTYYQSGSYRDTLIASYGVDSVVVLNLTVMDQDKTIIDTVVCPGLSIKVGDRQYSEDGNYEIKLTNQNGCDSLISLDLKVSIMDTSVQTYSDLGCRCGSISLTVSGNAPPYSYRWEDGSINSELSSLTKGIYTVEVKDKSGCKNVYTFDIKDEIPYMIPNALIPGNTEVDVNKKFWIYLTDRGKENPRVKITSTEIYDRWGELVFSSQGDIFWDGTYHENPMPAGIYLYKITIESPCGTEVKKGQVTLLR